MLARYQQLTRTDRAAAKERATLSGRDCTGAEAPAVAGIVKFMSAPIDLQATFIPNDGEFFRVKLALEIAIDEVVNEPGCIRYELTEATEEKLVLTERWASEEDLDKHSKGTAVQDLNESLSALLAEPVRLERL